MSTYRTEMSIVGEREATPLSRRESQLKRKLSELTDVGLQREDVKIETAADPLDQVILSADRALAITRLEVRGRLLRDVQDSLVKVKGDNYGLCEECDEPISPRRLDAVPWARLCIRCQAKAESSVEQELLYSKAA